MTGFGYDWKPAVDAGSPCSSTEGEVVASGGASGGHVVVAHVAVCAVVNHAVPPVVAADGGASALAVDVVAVVVREDIVSSCAWATIPAPRPIAVRDHAVGALALRTGWGSQQDQHGEGRDEGHQGCSGLRQPEHKRVQFSFKLYKTMYCRITFSKTKNKLSISIHSQYKPNQSCDCLHT